MGNIFTLFYPTGLRFRLRLSLRLWLGKEWGIYSGQSCFWFYKIIVEIIRIVIDKTVLSRNQEDCPTTVYSVH